MAHNGSPDADAERPVPHRSPTSAEIRQWCDSSCVTGDRGELSTIGALLIASGYLTPAGRAILVRRISTGLPLPSLPAGFADLRRLQRAIVSLEHQLGAPMVPGVVAAVLRNRLNGLLRRREDARKSIVAAKGVFAGSTRAVRRERRENVYLEMDERERLFAGLLCTPSPNVNASSTMRRVGSVAVERIAGVVGQVAARSGRPRAGQWATQISTGSVAHIPPYSGAVEGVSAAAPGASHFVDGYETLLFIAAHYYDRITINPAWRSDHFAMQRTQVNLHAELAEIAADVIALRAVRVELDRAKRSGGFDHAFAEQIDRRESVLRPVWTELIDRVQALAEVAHVVESAAVELRILAEYNRAATIDDRIDALIARSGDREISVDNAKRLTEQVRSGEEQLRIYRDVLQGNISRISPVVPRELPARYEPS
ncbi:MAG: hypothetical protein QM673_06875 [Gordonia sp. (in: high G+C Gram-positive bacteria)]